MATLILKRPSKWIDLARSYKVYVDGKKTGALYDDETKEFDIAPGQHIIKAKIDFFSSKPIHFEVKNDAETKKMLVKNNTSLWVFAILIFICYFLVDFIFESFIKRPEYMKLFIIVITIPLVFWSYYRINPYLKIEQVEELN